MCVCVCVCLQSIYKGIDRKGEMKTRKKVVLYNYIHTHVTYFALISSLEKLDIETEHIS